jgi:hypothetical protein
VGTIARSNGASSNGSEMFARKSRPAARNEASAGNRSTRSVFTFTSIIFQLSFDTVNKSPFLPFPDGSALFFPVFPAH